MTLSIKKIFSKKEENTVEEKKLTSNESHKENKADEKKVKHDTPSGCCGSCS